jgi:hypothetical protein
MIFFPGMNSSEELILFSFFLLLFYTSWASRHTTGKAIKKKKEEEKSLSFHPALVRSVRHALHFPKSSGASNTQERRRGRRLMISTLRIKRFTLFLLQSFFLFFFFFFL